MRKRQETPSNTEQGSRCPDYVLGVAAARSSDAYGMWRSVASCTELDGQEAHNAALIAAAVNALPELLAVYEAACAWRDEDMPRAEALHAVVDAIDAARGKR